MAIYYTVVSKQFLTRGRLLIIFKQQLHGNRRYFKNITFYII